MERETSFLVQWSLSVERGRRACSSDDHNDDDHDDHDSGHDVGHYDDGDELRLQNFESVIILKPT